MIIMKFVASRIQIGPEKIMQFCLVSPLAEVDLAHPVRVDGVPLVWVDNNLNTFWIFQSFKDSNILSIQGSLTTNKPE